MDLRAVVRSVGGTYVAHGLPEHTPVDALAPLDEFVVVGSHDFGTLLTGPVDRLVARLGSGGAAAEVAAGGVYITGADGPGLRALLAEHGMSAILGAGRAAGSAPTDGLTTVRTSADAQAALEARVAALLAADQAASDRLVTTGTKVLTQAARRGGANAVIAELAHRIDGWAVLLDSHGLVIATAGAGRLHIGDAVAVALGKPVRVRHPGLQVHQVGSDRDRTGFLVIATRSSVTSRNRDLASQAAALFDLVLRTPDPSRTEQLGREALLRTLLEGGPSATSLLARWGVRGSELTAFQLGTRTRTIDLERLCIRWLDELGAEHIYVREGPRVSGFLPDTLSAALAERVAAFRPPGPGSVHLGLGLPTPQDRLGQGAIQARLALDTALDDGRTVLRYAELPTVELVLGAMEHGTVAQLAAVLDALRGPDGLHGELATTLQVFLSTHGAQRLSAERLGIHRRTLTSRIKRVEDLTGLSMDRPDDRATAWLAVRALGIPGPAKTQGAGG